ncbi:hypothetical protein LTR37_010557 [Vermiconidia calcicola]|uniref:Uncharacterized protein n=1 Tax=Vermiconidia calcicola TaxID=1690605 RepID=A0ACC3N4G9_9PEZI|nr:hypothetical protein LTR37_010557 [Vermiconidia calcicola]
MDDDGSQTPEISLSRTSSASSKVISCRNNERFGKAQKSSKPSPKGDINDSCQRPQKHHKWGSRQSPDTVKWKIKWTDNRFRAGRVLIIDYISHANVTSAGSGKPHVTVEAQEFEDIKGLEKFYSNSPRVHGAALRLIHVQNATWATSFLLRKFNIDHRDELVGMPGFSKWARFEKPRQRNGRPFPDGRSWREQTDPWRNVSRTAFGMDYLKVHLTPPRNRRRRAGVFGDKSIDAQMLHLNAWSDERNPDGYDRNLGPRAETTPDQEIKNPYRHTSNGHWSKDDERKVNLKYLDNSNTVIIFETSASMLLEDCLVQPRNDFEKRWRRLSFYLKRADVLNDARLAAQCTNMILGDIFHGLAVVWQEFLNVAADHVNILEDKIYETPADESRAPELWTNQAAWRKVDKVMWIHQDLIKEVQAHMAELPAVEVEGEETLHIDWLATTPAEYERLAHSVTEDLDQPTANLSDLMYKSVGIRDSRQSLQLELSMWRLSWITFIFLPLVFVVSFFGMNVDILGGDDDSLPSVAWYLLSAAILMIFVLILWYCAKHSLQRGRQTPYQRGLYENLFNHLEDQYPNIWTREGAVDDLEPVSAADRLKWRLLKRWFAPERTVNKKLYSSLIGGDEETDLGSWARFKRYLLKRWLPTIQLRHKPGDAIIITEQDRPHSANHYEAGTITYLAEPSTAVAFADTEPTAVQQFPTYELQPMDLQGRRTDSLPNAPRLSEDRPSSRGSSGIMVEERDLSDMESEVAEGATALEDDGRRRRRR